MGLESPSRELREARILVVDDEPENVRVLERLLGRVGYQEVVSTTDPRDAVPLFEAHDPDLVLLDLRMPHMDGFEVLEAFQERTPSGVYLPVLVLTGDLDPEVKERTLRLGARDFLTKPFETTEVLLRIKNLLETRRLHSELRDYSETLESRVRERTRELAHAQVEILHRLALAAEYRDDDTGQHAERVGVLSALVARTLDLPTDEVRVLRRAAPLHDLGKIGIPDAILMKPGPLTPAEYEIMKTHTEIGAKILSGSRYPLLETARTIALTHHEKWDGSGYTPGMAGDEIPRAGRIVSVADAFDSLTHRRPYRPPSSVPESLEEIRSCRGEQFDPEVVDAFLEVAERVDPEALNRLTGVPATLLAKRGLEARAS